jgi:surface polysaccharide O-acyltransferase-like enzyme
MFLLVLNICTKTLIQTCGVCNVSNIENLNRQLGIDLLRILSAIAVIVIHISAPIMTSPFLYQLGNAFWWSSNILDSLSRFSVPMFVIISGYSFSLIINSTVFFEKSKSKFTKLTIITLFWSLIFIAFRILRGDFVGSEGILDIFVLAVAKPLLAGLPYFHLWYLYMALGLFFVAAFAVPILGRINDAARKPLLFSVMVISLLFSLQNYYYDNNLLFVFWFIEYIFYFMLGLYAPKLSFNINRKLALVGFILIALCDSLLVSAMVRIYGADRGQYFFEFVSPFVMLQTFFIFYIFKTFNAESPKFIVLLARLTLPVYLVHPFVTESVAYYVRESQSIVYLFFGILVSVMLSFILSFLLSKVPGVRRFVI